ncbi:hypothetical protein [Telmatospirillum siberiense]|uniref:Uncharacterized protein n=1 Tax=Telmatospirillum siberiense TaxID=382514 RepID=A0A2N3PYJ1_9PROT|nr:hypothetical protein [Telmatospirillum siberiense]PKU25480.1 hypothetical protein CWS72_05275 [Telmatospirillum siberiense]
MGLSSPPAARPLSQPLGPKEFIWIAALGIAARSPASIDDVCLVIDDVADQRWTPVSDVVASTIAEMLADGALRPSHRASETFETTDAGWEILAAMFARPSGRPGCLLGEVGFRLKLAFIDLAPMEARHLYLSDTIRAYEGEIEACEQRCRHCAIQGPFARKWLDHETDRLRSDLSLLHSMAAECGISDPSRLSYRKVTACATR